MRIQTRNVFQLLLIVPLGLIVGVTLLFGSQIQGTWEDVGRTSFSGGYGQAIVSTDAHVYVLRQRQAGDNIHFVRYEVQDEGSLGFPEGLDNPRRSIKDPECQDFKNGTALAWDRNDSIYALTGGAYDDQDRRCFLRYSISEDTWERPKDTPIPQGAGDALTYVKIADTDYIYAFIGAATEERSGAFNEFMRFDIEQNRWDRLSIPQGWECVDDGVALAWDGDNFIYALHGAGCQDDSTQDFARFSLAAETWEDLQMIPEPVDDGGSLAWDGKRYLYAVVGKGSSGFYRFDTQMMRWEDLPSLECPASSFNGNRLVFIKGFLFYWQGSPGDAVCGGNDIQRFTPVVGSEGSRQP